MSEHAAELQQVAALCLDQARSCGAQEASARAYRVREVSLRQRDGKLEHAEEAVTRGVGLQLYVDGRYAAVSTNDLREATLRAFIADSVALTRRLAVDPLRSLPDPALYAGQSTLDLDLNDASYIQLDAERRRAQAGLMEAAARAGAGDARILSITTQAGDAHTVSVRLHSNGFAGRHSETSFHLSAEVSLQDDDGRRPEEYAFATAHHQEDLPAAPTIGAEALRRAQARLGAVQGPSARLTMVVENRVAGGLLAALLGPLSAQALQQKRSFLDGRQGQRIGSALLTVHDDPLIVRGLGSRRYDSEGLAARRLALFDEGRLANYFVDTYYGKKLGLGPTTAGASNIVWVLGAQDRDTLIRDVQDGILVTGFLGGNSNAVTGDFSFGIQGARIRAGQLTEPVNEMNLAGNQLDLWPRLAAVGNDPYPYSASATPTLCFEMAQFAGG